MNKRQKKKQLKKWCKNHIKNVTFYPETKAELVITKREFAEGGKVDKNKLWIG